MARQGPHQAAQKSISTGLSDFNTSESKLASVTSTVALPAIHPPDFSGSCQFPQSEMRGPVRAELLSYIVALLIGCSARAEVAERHRVIGPPKTRWDRRFSITRSPD